MEDFSKAVTCVLIRPNGRIEKIKLSFNFYGRTVTSNKIVEYMSDKFDMKCNLTKCVQAFYPDNSSFSVFIQSKTDPELVKNPVATHILNNNHLVNKGKQQDYYGDCIIIHFDGLCEMYDVDYNTFVTCYNKVYTDKGVDERDFDNRLSVFELNDCNVCVINKEKDKFSSLVKEQKKVNKKADNTVKKKKKKNCIIS